MSVDDNDQIQRLLHQAITSHTYTELSKAESRYLDVLTLNPHHGDSLRLLHLLALQRNDTDRANHYLNLAIDQDGRPGVLFNLGRAFEAEGRLDDAEAAYRAGLAFEPADPRLHHRLGLVLADRGCLGEALESLKAAARLAPDDWQTQHYLSRAYQRLGHPLEGLHHHKRVLQLAPASQIAEVRLARSHDLLATGHLEEGWREYEWRWKTQREIRKGERPQGEEWNGDALGDRTLLVYAEQGHGDTIQFCRYLSMVPGTVVAEVQPALKRLMSQIPNVQVVACGEPFPRFDLQTPMLSLPARLGTTLETIPAPSPYLKADPIKAAAWASCLGKLPGLRVGLVWAGARHIGNLESAQLDNVRSMPLSSLAPLGEVPGVSFVALTQTFGRSQLGSMPIHDFASELSDFSDTAALVENLDLVISVDTAVAHLAGTLGKPVWLMNRFDPCWRWMLDRDDSPWYPTLRQFRQPRPGDWSSVVHDVRTALDSMVSTA